jgi:DNA modification methylase
VSLCESGESGVFAPRAEVIHGDCLAVMRGMPPRSFDAVITDPPYGTGQRILAGPRKGNDFGPLRHSVLAWDVWSIRWVFAAETLLRKGGHLVSFCPVQRMGDLIRAADEAGLPYVSHVVWRKPNPLPNYGGRPSNATEDALIFGGGRLNARGEPNVWDGRAPRGGSGWDEAGTGHPHQKPVGLMRWLCRLVTPPRGLVLDPFCGSGSTLVAAALEGFDSVGIEQSAEYVAIARRRAAAAAQPRLDLDPAPLPTAEETSPAEPPPPRDGASRLLPMFQLDLE